MADTHTAAETIKGLYGRITDDWETHQRTIDAQLRKLDMRRQSMLRRLALGESYHEIARAEGITAAAARDTMLRAIERMRKAIAGEPRFNHVGRKRGK